MKTKSYKIYTSNGDWVEVSETQEMDKIKLRLQTGGVIMLNHQAWGELCAMKYELQCNEPGMEASQVPELTSEADTVREFEKFNVDLPMADKTINKLMKEAIDV